MNDECIAPERRSSFLKDQKGVAVFSTVDPSRQFPWRWACSFKRSEHYAQNDAAQCWTAVQAIARVCVIVSLVGPVMQSVYSLRADEDSRYGDVFYHRTRHRLKLCKCRSRLVLTSGNSSTINAWSVCGTICQTTSLKLKQSLRSRLGWTRLGHLKHLLRQPWYSMYL